MSTAGKNRRWRRWTVRGLLGIAAICVVVPVGAALFQLVASIRDDARLTPPGDMVDIGGGRILHVHCVGEGLNTPVFLENGLGVVSDAWVHVQSSLAATGRVCAYDRAGTGWSGEIRGPRNALAAAEDLAALLDKLEINQPVILAGHSYGGVVARLFATRHRDRVAGLVLVDSSHEDMGTRLPAPACESLQELLSAFGTMRILNVFGGLRFMGVPEPWEAGLAGEALERARARYFSVHHMAGAAAEAEAWSDDTSPGQARAITTLADLPMTVITVDGYPAFMLSAWHEMQRELVAKSDQSRFVVVEGADHYGLIHKPEFAARVADEIGKLARKE